MRLKLTLIFILFLQFFLPSSSSPQKKNYDQSCSSTADCDEEQGLLCHSRNCKCDPSGSTVYSLTAHRCVGAAGRECLKSRNETFCVPNSKCHDYGYMELCTCKEGYYQSQDGNCYRIAKYGDACLEEAFSCGDTMSTSISCVDKQCRCFLGEENQRYSESEGKCTSFVGSQCVPQYHRPCPNNSYCGEIHEQIGGASFMAGYKCLCAPGFSAGKGRQCLSKFGTPCGPELPCNYEEFLGCLNGVCQCRNPLNEIYNPATQQCAILVGSTCKPGKDAQKCVENAACVPADKVQKFGRCQCNAGYSPTPSNTCMLDINQKCSPGSCNFYNSLTCVNETCNCIDSSLSYDKSSKACVALVGFPCGTVTLLNEEKEKEVVVLCEPNATCSKIPGPAGHYNGGSRRVCVSKTPVSSSSSNSKI